MSLKEFYLTGLKVEIAVWIGKVADPWTNLNKPWNFSNMTSSFIWTNENIFIYQLFCQQLI